MAAAIALLIATALPVTYFQLQHSYTHGKVDADASSLSYRLSQLISDHPLMWRFRADLLTEVLGQFSKEQQQIRLYSSEELIVQSGASDGDLGPSWLSGSASHLIYDSGRVIGRVELRVSEMPLALQTLILSALTAALGLAVFFVLRQVPLRALDNALKEVSYLASHDPLTDLPNRNLFRDRLQQALAQSERHADQVAVICIDLDHFKDVNDTLGHGIGDELLR